MREGKTNRRLVVGITLYLAILVLFCVELISLQVIKGEAYLAKSERSVAKTETIEAARGQILDRFGNPLVTNRATWQMTLDVSQMKQEKEDTLLSLTELCTKAEVSWQDSLPISQHAPYQYSKDRLTETDLYRYEQYLKSLSLEEPSDATELLDHLAGRYQLSENLSPRKRRILLGILYELDLRKRNVTSSRYLFASDVSVDFITSVKELGLSGVLFTASSERDYKTTAAAHLLGRVGQMNESEWDTYQASGYDLNERVGKSGVEQTFESYLHGVKGLRSFDTDLNGKLVTETYLNEPTPGQTILLTLDRALQEKTEAVLAERLPTLEAAEGAAVAILDVKTGGVLTLASYPTYDLSQFSAQYHEIQQDPLRPLYNRALQGTYAPGSTFKMVTAVAGLEEGIITPETKLLCTGRYTYYKHPQPYCWIYREKGKTHGAETVTDAIKDSCNIFFYDVGRRLGISRIETYTRLFGLGEQTGIELAGESTGVIAGPSYTESLGQTWYDGNTLSAAIGQENNRFTPLQLASYVATLANGGNRYKVHLLKEVHTSNGRQTVLETQPELLDSLSLNPDYLQAVKEGMLGVTETGSVSAYFKKLPVKVGAKTGSAQVSGSEEANAVFVCFAPYDDPQIAMAIVVEKGGSGSYLGRMAAEILNEYFQGNAVFGDEVITVDEPLPE